MTVALVVVTDGRGEYLAQTVASLREQLKPYPEYRYMVDDSADTDYRGMLNRTYGHEFTICHHDTRRGFVATVGDAWKIAVTSPQVEYVFHAEDDFTYNQPIDIDRMVDLLDRNPYLAQLALKRQPVNHEERMAGDFMAAHPRETWRQRDGFIVHEKCWTTNPSLIPRRVVQLMLRSGIELAEMATTWFLLERGYKLGFLGRVKDKPLVQHIGDYRANGAWF